MDLIKLTELYNRNRKQLLRAIANILKFIKKSAKKEKKKVPRILLYLSMLKRAPNK